MSNPRGWTRESIQNLLIYHASGPSPTCEERNIADDEEWGLLKTTAVTWKGWDATAHKVPPKHFWGDCSIEVRAGDVLVTKAGPRDRCGVSVYISETPPRLMVSGKMVLLRPDMQKTNAPFLASALATEDVQRFLDCRTTGLADAQLNFTNQLLLHTMIDLPSPAEQAMIAEIRLGLDEAIEQTQALIKKMEKIKDGVMHDLFARGITPDNKLRPPREDAPELYRESPLGWVPAEWEIGFLSDFLQGGPKNGYSPTEIPEWAGMYSLGLGCLTSHGFEPIQLKNVWPEAPGCRNSLLREGDLLLSRSNTREFVGLCGTYVDVGAPCIYPDLMMRIRPNRRTTAAFLETLLLSPLMRLQISSAAVGTSGSMVKLNAKSVMRLHVAVPEVQEQERILSVVRLQKKYLGTLGADREKLKELKQGLMHDLLTGQVRVPTTEVTEPEQVEANV